MQHVRVSKYPGNQTAQVDNGPLVMAFHRIFLRNPSGDEADIQFTDDDMRDMADDV